MSFRSLKRANQEIARLRGDCAEAYQVVGCLVPPRARGIRSEDFERALDNLCAAAEGRPRPHSDLLPWPKERKAK